ncbi:MAG TPA: hypothetical protein VFA04_03670 [Bryobacteraceae bacterium]|jgi:hypothetical protein|nr:hypothetical protein [Bryobacteraceae bacterium]
MSYFPQVKPRCAKVLLAVLLALAGASAVSSPVIANPRPPAVVVWVDQCHRTITEVSDLRSKPAGHGDAAAIRLTRWAPVYHARAGFDPALFQRPPPAL